jgi:SsrA-binding protein
MRIINKKARFDFEILNEYETGIQLNGAEVKSAKNGKISLDGAFVKIVGTEIFLLNAQIHPYFYARTENIDTKRTRKLLMHKKEILSLKNKIDTQRLTLVPLECYNRKGFVKLKIGLARGLKKYEKREKIKKEDIKRQVERELRGK